MREFILIIQIMLQPAPEAGPVAVTKTDIRLDDMPVSFEECVAFKRGLEFGFYNKGVLGDFSAYPIVKVTCEPKR